MSGAARGPGRSRVAAVLLAVLVGVGGGAGSAAAHGGGDPTGTVSVAQTLGARDLTVTFSPPPDGAGPMLVRASALGPETGGPLRVQVVPLSGDGAGRPLGEATVPLGPGARSAAATLRVDRPGPWEVLVSDGPDVGRIPLTVPETVVPAWVWAVRGGIAAVVLCGVGAAFTAFRRPRLAVGLGGGVLVGVTVIVTAATLATTAASTTAAPTPTAPVAVGHEAHTPGMDMGAGTGTGTGSAMDMGAGTDSGMGSGMDMSTASGHGSGAVVLTTAVEGASDAGGRVDLRLRFTDGSTGAPVDDLVVHDDAFIHLVVIGPGGRLSHVHPVRVGPGSYTVRLPSTDPGGYGVFAELERADGGHQVARSAVALGPAPGVPPAPPAEVPLLGSGVREVAGLTATVVASPAVAGRTSRVEVEFSRDGRPVRDLQSWLGMAGHLMVLGPAAPGAPVPDPTDPVVSFAHVHDMTAPVGGGLGPRVGFSYAFPTAGRYQLWAQVQHDWQIVTVPVSIDVAPAPVPPAM